jgi:hypothetical protein
VWILRSRKGDFCIPIILHVLFAKSNMMPDWSVVNKFQHRIARYFIDHYFDHRYMYLAHLSS